MDTQTTLVASHPDPPAYAFPNEFTISSHRTPSLINLSQVKGHLALLQAFAELRLQVDNTSDPKEWDLAHVPKDKERIWGWFVGMAVERFDLWIHSKGFPVPATGEPIDDYLPPLDVIMVWHAYMLNPTFYAEDLQRSVLVGLERLPKNPFAALLERAPAILKATPSTKRVENWRKHSGTAFNPVPPFDFDNGGVLNVLTKRSIKCFWCRTSFNASHLTERGTGYLQSKFSMQCPNCKATNTKDTLAFRKLHDNLVLKKSIEGDRSFLAGTLRTPNNARDIRHAHDIKTNVITSIARTVNREEKSIRVELGRALLGVEVEALCLARKFKSMKQVQEAVRYGSVEKKLAERICSAYVDDKPYSIDLVGAVQRQSSFVKKMYDLKWTERDFFWKDEDEVALKHAIARYHAFLDLMSSTPTGFFVPTLDIDLAWHTHQLLGEKYHTDCMTYVGRYVDHDDKVEENRLSSAFDLTCRAWQQRFHIRYTHCGCPVPGETMGQKLIRIVSPKFRSTRHLHPPKHRKLLAATHPSDHNAVFDMRNKAVAAVAAAARKRREMEMEKCRSKDKERREDGPHDVAFLAPVPLYHGGCVAWAGGIEGANTVGSCASTQQAEHGMDFDVSIDMGGDAGGGCGGSGGCGDGCGGGCGGCGG